MKANRQKTILLADDDVNLRRVLEFQLTETGYQVWTAQDGAEAFEIFAQNDFDCVITDLRMPKLSGLELLGKIKTENSEIPVIVITAFGEVETAVTAMKAGAFDYINKPFNRDEILLTLERALNFSETKSENRQLRELVDKEFRIENVIGDSPQMRAVLNLVGRVSRSDATVLITGESGTGKELIAKGIHFSGKRRGQPLIPINCAAIPETLIEAELFGYKRGSFTGANLDTKGKFENATGGTLFLDEISQMPLALQPKLLRVLQEQEITRLGESEPRKIDVRIIAATNQNLEKMVEQGTFREDLYFRLAVVPVSIPPLRTCREDIPLLVNHFFRRAVEKHGFENLKITREVVNILSNYLFPGNVRELENLIERMVVLSDENSLTLDDVPDFISQPLQLFGSVKFELPAENISLDEVEREIIRYALDMHNGNQSQTARYLGITRSALIYRMQKSGLDE
ncbi:MAG: sigma-54 dependent transcriptional regulator [Pyrinomonadaceae bacterium]|nr:sigma-54 dependent transcriptional regulator [Pyrinomonadaceae bacterium]